MSMSTSMSMSMSMSYSMEERIATIQKYEYLRQLPTGDVRVRLMRPEEVDFVAELLAAEAEAASSSEATLAEAASSSEPPPPSLKDYIKKSLTKSACVLPHSATMVAVYKAMAKEEEEEEEEEEQVVGTVAVYFPGEDGSHHSLLPAPKYSPYCLNVAVKPNFRRLSIGLHLVKAVVELAHKLCPCKDIYFHVNVKGPVNFYKRQGYVVVETDDNKHLMAVKWQRSNL